MSNPKHVRFSDADWYGDMPEVSIGGVGGIGSWLAVLLSRLGVYSYIHDMDTVDETNMGGQLYGTDMIGLTKEEAVEKMVTMLSDGSVEKMGMFTEDSFVSEITFSAFDNMKARKLMFEAWKNNPDREIFIDGRMLMEQGMVFAVTPDRIEEYEKHLFNDDEVEDVACSAKATSHSGAIIAGLMVSLFTNYLVNKKAGVEIRELPFKFDYNIHLMMFNEPES